jgi:2-iminobutanoate/2-iminopropanoate deaminase
MTLFSRIAIGMVAATVFFGLSATPRAKDFIKQVRPQQRGYSAAVITEGGKTVWLAGQTATVDDSGKSLAGEFEGQARQIFKLLNATLEKTGGKLSDMVQMTVFITDVRYGDRLTQIRREIFGDNFPGSALITIPPWPIPMQRSRYKATPSSEANRPTSDTVSPLRSRSVMPRTCPPG